jgi:hypothetical protein
MREGFNELLHEYGDIAKDAAAKGLPAEQDPQLKHRLKKTRRAASEEFQTAPEVQSEVFEIQERKQAIVAEYRRAARQLKSPEYQPEMGATPVTVENGQYFAERRNGKLMPITRGELLTDGEWGVSYGMDSAVDVPTRLGYLKAKARRALRDLYNLQILLQESGSGLTHEFKRQAYERMRHDREAGVLHPGHIAEKMVRNFLTKLSIDHEIDFEIIEADVFQDVDQKIDFVIHRKSHRRGISVVTDESEKSVGIQFTTSQDVNTLEHKQHQLDTAKRHLRRAQVDDIVLVSMPISEFMTAYSDWQKDKTPGGPDKLWPEEIRAQIFHEVMKGVFTPDEIEQEWAVISEENIELPMAA